MLHVKCRILLVGQNFIKYSALKSPNGKQSVNIHQTKTSKRQSIPHQDKEIRVIWLNSPNLVDTIHAKVDAPCKGTWHTELNMEEMHFTFFLPFLLRLLLYPAVILQKGPSFINIMCSLLSAFNCNRGALLICKCRETCLENEHVEKFCQAKLLLHRLK